MDKYLYVEFVHQIGCSTKYSWLGHSIYVIEYNDGHKHPFPWQIFGIGCFSTLLELDQKLEELWQKAKQNIKSEKELSSL